MAEASAVHGTVLLSIAPCAAPWSGALASSGESGGPAESPGRERWHLTLCPDRFTLSLRHCIPVTFGV